MRFQWKRFQFVFWMLSSIPSNNSVLRECSFHPVKNLGTRNVKKKIDLIKKLPGGMGQRGFRNFKSHLQNSFKKYFFKSWIFTTHFYLS